MDLPQPLGQGRASQSLIDFLRSICPEEASLQSSPAQSLQTLQLRVSIFALDSMAHLRVWEKLDDILPTMPNLRRLIIQVHDQQWRIQRWHNGTPRAAIDTIVGLLPQTCSYFTQRGGRVKFEFVVTIYSLEA